MRMLVLVLSLTQAYGNDKGLLGGIKVKNVATGEVQDYEVNGLFFAIGHKPATDFLGGQVRRAAGLRLPVGWVTAGLPTASGLGGRASRAAASSRRPCCGRACHGVHATERRRRRLASAAAPATPSLRSMLRRRIRSCNWTRTATW